MGQERKSWLARFEAVYPLMIAGMVSAGNVIMTLAQTVIISFGLLFILCALMLVEQHGIKDGLLWFMTDISAAGFAAGAAVVLNLMVDMHIVHIEREGKYKAQPGQAWSLRLWARSLRYRAGIGGDWKPKRNSPAQRFIMLRVFITVTIFVLALSGRMRVAIDQVSETQSGAALDAGTGVHKLLFESSLADVFRWTGGTLFTMLAVISVQSLTHYMASRVMEIQADLKRRAANLKAAETRQRQREARLSASIQRTDADGRNDKGSSIRTGADGQRTDSGHGYQRNSNAKDMVRQHLIDNPGDVKAPVRELAARLNVGKSTVSDVQREFRQ